MKLRAVFRFIRETNNSLLIILPGLLFSLGLAQFAMILFVFFQSPKANLLLLAIVVFNLCAYRLQAAERKIDVKVRNMGY